MQPNLDQIDMVAEFLQRRLQYGKGTVPPPIGEDRIDFHVGDDIVTLVCGCVGVCV